MKQPIIYSRNVSGMIQDVCKDVITNSMTKNGIDALNRFDYMQLTQGEDAALDFWELCVKEAQEEIAVTMNPDAYECERDWLLDYCELHFEAYGQRFNPIMGGCR